MNRLVTPAVLNSSSMRQDKSVRLSFSTNELTDEEWILLKRMQNEAGFLMFQSNEVSEKDLSMFDNIDEDLFDVKKSPSQRLRNTLYVLYQKTSPSPTDDGFKVFYKEKMEQLISHFKEKIPE